MSKQTLSYYTALIYKQTCSKKIKSWKFPGKLIFHVGQTFEQFSLHCTFRSITWLFSSAIFPLYAFELTKKNIIFYTILIILPHSSCMITVSSNLIALFFLYTYNQWQNTEILKSVFKIPLLLLYNVVNP